MMHRIGGALAHVSLGVLLILAPAARPHAQASSEQVWTSSAPMPTPRSELAAAALRNRIYAAGGIAQFGTTAAFEAYDAEHDSWEPGFPRWVGARPTPNTNFGCKLKIVRQIRWPSPDGRDG